MRFILDENIPRDSEALLRARGHEVIRPARGTTDRRLALLSRLSHAILLTRDRDFLDLLPSLPWGLILVRIHPPIAEHITAAVAHLLRTLPERDMSRTVVIVRRDSYELIHPIRL